MKRAEKSNANSQPRTAAELLDQEESLAMNKLAGSVERLGEDLCVAADLRAKIRSHPFLATGISACLGFIASPILLRTAKQAFVTSAVVRRSLSATPQTLPGLLVSSLRGIRGPF